MEISSFLIEFVRIPLEKKHTFLLYLRVNSHQELRTRDQINKKPLIISSAIPLHYHCLPRSHINSTLTFALVINTSKWVLLLRCGVCVFLTFDIFAGSKGQEPPLPAPIKGQLSQPNTAL